MPWSLLARPLRSGRIPGGKLGYGRTSPCHVHMRADGPFTIEPAAFRMKSPAGLTECTGNSRMAPLLTMANIKYIGYYYTRFGCAGVSNVIKAKLTKRALLLTVRGHGLQAPLYLRTRTTDVLLFDEVFLRHEYAFTMSRPPAVIIDAGANSGLVSVYFANRFPQARIIAVEPEASNYQLLERNVAPYSNIVPVNAALWDKNEELALVDPDLGKWGFMTQAPDRVQASPGRFIHTVRGMTVDAIMQEQDLQRVDILKIDIEGSEREVFEDPSRWIGRVDALIVELHERMRSGCNRSFYTGTSGFDDEWQQGEHVCVTRSGACLTRPA